MAFQTNVLRDGQWVTETINLQTVLKASAANSGALPLPKLTTGPSRGILTRTVIESPVVHWILPVRLRSANHNDVAFIGDYFVQISEFREDQQLHHVARKTDFGSRICNARVIGSTPVRPPSEDPVADSILGTEDDEDVSMNGASVSNSFPPQLLVLVLECGKCVFLFFGLDEDGNLGFLLSCFDGSPKRVEYPGLHFAIDPSYRYMALARTESLFVIYELESMDELGKQHALQLPLTPVRSYHPRAVQGVIHKMEFLYPGDDSDHIILLLIIIRDGKSRMVIYEWMLGDSLRGVLSQEKQGHRLPVEHQMSLLLIPLTVRSSFLAVSQKSIGVCKDALQGPPTFDDVKTQTTPTSNRHYGTQDPLWTAWSRPFRRNDFHRNKDNIYLAREDGAVMYFEIDSDDVLSAGLHVGDMGCNISAAFSNIFDRFADILIIAGDSSPGAIWKLPPRAPATLIGTVPNWSPAVDFVTTHESPTWSLPADLQGSRPHRLFSISGRGTKGAVTEHRYGIEASLYSDIAYDVSLKQAWIFPAQAGTNLLLTLPGSSAMLHLSHDLSQASEPDSTEAIFDMSSRTLAASEILGDMIIQITEKTTTMISRSQRTTKSHEHILGMDDVAVDQAIIRGSSAAVSTRSTSMQPQSRIFFLGFGEDLDISVIKTYQVDGEVTTLALCAIGERGWILAGIWRQGQPSLALFPTSDTTADSPLPPFIPIDLTTELRPSQAAIATTADILSRIEAINSIVVIDEKDNGAVVLLMGTRSGHALMLEIPGERSSSPILQVEKYGEVSLEVFDAPGLPESSAFAICDGSLIFLTQLSSLRFKTKHRIWLTDYLDPSMISPPINFVTVWPQPSYDDDISLAMLADQRILLARLRIQPGPLPRHISINGVPTKLIYSHRHRCLVVAMLVGDKPTIAFLDPDSGEEISQATDKGGNQVDFISGLGQSGDKIYGLYEWLYTKDGKTWLFIIVTTKCGQLLIVSTEDIPDPGGRIIRYWTRNRRKGFENAVLSVVGDNEGLVFCVGKVLHWETLDLTEKKLKPKKKYELESPATSLRVVNGLVLALTQNHSLVVIDLTAPLTGTEDEMNTMHSDPVSRPSMHLITIGGPDDGAVTWPITLLCDRNRAFAGVWAPTNRRGKELEVVFEGRLPASIRRLRRGRTRPAWARQGDVKYGMIPSASDGAEVLGLCLDGSLQHFTLLDLDIWRFFRLIQNTANKSERMYPFTYSRKAAESEPVPVTEPPAMMHIDGDMLQRCLGQRALEDILGNRTNLMREYLNSVEGGKWTEGFGSNMEKYFELAYDILEYYLAPVL